MAVPNLNKELRPEDLELKGFSRSLAEIEWLLMILILVSAVIPGIIVDTTPILLACLGYAAFIVAFRYYNLLTMENRWKLAIETWAMIGLTAFVVWHSGKSGSPLINLYLLPIIFSALTLGKLITLLQVVLIASLFTYAAADLHGGDLMTQEIVTGVAFKFVPFVLVAYLTSLLAADMNFAKAFAQNLSETDELTGLPNMRAFRTAIERERARADREETRFSVIMIDADNLKAINDRYGHESGNHLIQHMVGAIRHALRGSDYIARYGGDEFIVLLPNADAEHAHEAAERLRQSILNISFDADGETVQTTVSVGHATYPDHATDINDLLKKADRAMYMSKEAGRDRVTAYIAGA